MLAWLARNLVWGLLIVFLLGGLVVSGLVWAFAPEAPVVTVEVPGSERVVTQEVVVTREIVVTQEVLVTPQPEAEQAVVEQPAQTDLWGPAGMAPQTRAEATQVLGVPESALTELFLAPGDATVIGWVVGTPPYEQAFTANVFEGLCVDYIRSSGKVNATTDWHIAFNGVDWNRAFVNGAGTSTDVKQTIYWSVCDQEGDFDLLTGQQLAEEQPAAQPEAVCPTFAGVATTALPDGGCKLSLQSSTVTDIIPEGWWVLDEKGRHEDGQLTTQEASFYRDGS